MDDQGYMGRRTIAGIAALLLCLFYGGAAAWAQSTSFSGASVVSFGTPYDREPGLGSPLWRVVPNGEHFTAYGTPFGSAAGNAFFGYGDGYTSLENGDAANHTDYGNVYQVSNTVFSTPTGEIFPIAGLKYHNAETWAGTSYRGIPLNMSLNFFLMDPAPQAITFNFDFRLNITTNSGPGGTPDELTFVNTTAAQSFEYNARRYTVELLGFRTDALSPVVHTFVLPERQTVEAQLLAQFVEAENDSQITAAPVAFGRVMRGQTPTRPGVLNKTGGDGTSFQIKQVSSTGLTVSPMTGGVGGGSVTRDLDVRLENNANGTGSTGNKAYTFVVDNIADTSAGAGMGSQDPDDTVNVTATVVQNRVITADPINLPKMLVGTSRPQPVFLRTTGADDHNTRVTVNAGAYANGGGTVSFGASNLFDTASDTLAGSLSTTFTKAGNYTGPNARSTLLTVGNGAMTGENRVVSGADTLPGESVVPITVTYSAEVYDRGNASFTGTADVNTLTLDLGNITAGASASQNFSLWNLMKTAGYTANLKFDGVSASSGATGLFNLSLPALDTTMPAGNFLPASATFSGSTAGAFNASYTLNFSDDLGDIQGTFTTQKLTLNLTGSIAEIIGPRPDPPFLINPSFEDVRLDSLSPEPLVLSVGERTLGMAVTANPAFTEPRWVAGWSSENGDEYDGLTGVLRPNAAPDGRNVAYSGGFGGSSEAFIQQATGTLAAGFEYELSFFTGAAPSGDLAPDVQLLLYDGQQFIELTPTAVIEGDTVNGFTEWSQRYFLAPGDAQAGLPVFVRAGTDPAITGGTALYDAFYFGYPRDDTGGLLGDYNLNGQLDAGDIDLLMAEMRRSPNTVPPLDEVFDLTGDDVVGFGDLEHWVEVLKGTYLGDFNLDGKVNSVDLNILALNWQLSNTGWSTGDANGDGLTNSADLNQLALHWQMGVTGTGAGTISLAAAWSEALATVPEPSSLVVAGVALALAGARRRVDPRETRAVAA